MVATFRIYFADIVHCLYVYLFAPTSLEVIAKEKECDDTCQAPYFSASADHSGKIRGDLLLSTRIGQASNMTQLTGMGLGDKAPGSQLMHAVSLSNGWKVSGTAVLLRSGEHSMPFMPLLDIRVDFPPLSIGNSGRLQFSLVGRNLFDQHPLRWWQVTDGSISIVPDETYARSIAIVVCYK